MVALTVTLVQVVMTVSKTEMKKALTAVALIVIHALLVMMVSRTETKKALTAAVPIVTLVAAVAELLPY